MMHVWELMKKNWAALLSPVILHCTTFSGLCNKQGYRNYIQQYKKISLVHVLQMQGLDFFYLLTRTTVINTCTSLFSTIIANLIVHVLPGIFSYRLVSISGIKVGDEGANRNSL